MMEEEIRNILITGTTKSLCNQFRFGPQARNSIYPVTQIDSISDADHICKDGSNENYAVTIIPIAPTRKECLTIGEAVQVDMKNKPANIVRIKYVGKGPWIQDKKGMPGRPFEFEVVKKII